MMYQIPFLIKTNFQSQYECIFMVNVRTHVGFHSVSQRNLQSKKQIHNVSMKQFNETSMYSASPTIKSCLQSMVYKRPFVIWIRFQIQYTCIFMAKVRTHVQFDCVSQTRVISKNASFWWTDGRTLARWAPSVRKKVRPSAGKKITHSNYKKIKVWNCILHREIWRHAIKTKHGAYEK